MQGIDPVTLFAIISQTSRLAAYPHSSGPMLLRMTLATAVGGCSFQGCMCILSTLGINMGEPNAQGPDLHTG